MEDRCLIMRNERDHPRAPDQINTSGWDVSFARSFHVTFQALSINIRAAKDRPDLVSLAQQDATRSEVFSEAKIHIHVMLDNSEPGGGYQPCPRLQNKRYCCWQPSAILHCVITQKNTI
jgi:hypothetical protein